MVQSGRVVIGMDPHKRSVTIEVMAGDETILGGGGFATDPDGFTTLREYVRGERPVVPGLSITIAVHLPADRRRRTPQLAPDGTQARPGPGPGRRS